ncbi:TPA: hypothetical protein ACH3X2_001284 [Trebouxia sp. C0005]
MVNCLSAHVPGSVRHSCSLHDRTFSKSRCFAPLRQSHKQTGCRHNPHNSRPRRSTQQQDAQCSSGTDPATHTVSRRALGLCAALLAVQWGQANAAAQASPIPLYSLAAASQQQTNQVLPEATAVLQPGSTASKFKPGQKQVLAINKRVQTQNNAPLGFPNFVRDGYEIIILADGYQESQDGLIWKDFEEGKGALPQDGQQVTFDYTAYNESGSRIDSTYTKGRPAQTRLGINGLIPGFEKGIRSMKVGGKRRLVVSPALGPPVGPSTFFSAKQCEVFDVELLDVKSCHRRQVAMFSDVVCE